jgi:hypothetical protein
MTDTNDLVARLRAYEPYNHFKDGPLIREAADTIERLTIERDEARLRGDVHQGPMQGFAAIDPATANVDWRARATNLAAEIARLTRERDEAQRENMDMVWQRRSAEFRARVDEKRIAKLESERDEARAAALEEAAKVADARELHWSEDAEQSNSGAAAHIFRRKADAAEQIAAAIRALKEPT